MGKLFGFNIGRGRSDELHPFTKSSETDVGYKTDSTVLHSGKPQVSIRVNVTSVRTFKTARVRAHGIIKAIFLNLVFSTKAVETIV